MNHLTSEQIQGYIDGMSTSDLDLHLRTCPSCQQNVKALQAVDRSLRSIRLEQPSQRFTERVMKELGVTTAPSFAWMLFRNIAPLLALAIVIGVVVVALNVAGVFDTTEIQQTTTVTQTVYHQIGQGVQIFNGWMSKYFSFAFAKNTYGLTAFVFMFFAVIALLDKYVIMPRMRKRIM
jgi:hypothetical protein